jgi:hypothetical protein
MGLRGCGTTLVVMANECVQPAAENLQLFPDDSKDIFKDMKAHFASRVL